MAVESRTYILYNSSAGNGNIRDEIKPLEVIYNNPSFIEIRNIRDYKVFFGGLEKDDSVVICGGDGTLNRIVNEIADLNIKNDLWLYPLGNGNDFARDLGCDKDSDPIRINDYIKNLPVVTFKNKKKYFLNGVGYGIDGFCCQEADKIKEKYKDKKKINYTLIAIKGLIYKYKPTDVKITADGKDYEFKKVWLAPTMNGRFYGGGMMPTPNQQRLSEDKKLSLLVFHGSGKLKTLMIFPSIFEGKHVNKKKNVTIIEGKKIKVEYSTAKPMQIDGETVTNVKCYVACAEEGIKNAF